MLQRAPRSRTLFIYIYYMTYMFIRMRTAAHICAAMRNEKSELLFFTHSLFSVARTRTIDIRSAYEIKCTHVINVSACAAHLNCVRKLSARNMADLFSHMLRQCNIYTNNIFSAGNSAKIRGSSENRSSRPDNKFCQITGECERVSQGITSLSIRT